MKKHSQYEMSELVTQEQPADDDGSGVVNPFHRSGDTASESAESGIIHRKPVIPAKAAAASPMESMDFEDMESRQWRKHQLRRFFQNKGKRFSDSRMTTVWKWALLILLAVCVGCMGGFVKVLIGGLTSWKFGVVGGYMAEEKVASAFFSYVFMSLFYASVAYASCYWEPAALAGIPEVKAFLNGVDLSRFVKFRVVVAKLIGMCFAVSSGLPTGKKGPIIHIGATTGAAISQGGRKLMGFDASWQHFQDLRNDKTKRDFVTYGLAAGVAAVFRAPIGGCLFALEEGASFWSNTLTFRAFFCAMLSLFTVNLIFTDSTFGRSAVSGLFVFGRFENYDKDLTNYYSYEIFAFILLGVSGGIIGAAWNEMAKVVIKYYMTHMTSLRDKAIRVAMMVFAMCCISFFLSLSWQVCTPKPSEEETADWDAADKELLDLLVPFQCPEGTYNQVASLYLSSAEIAIRQLFHYREYSGQKHATFDAGPLFLFFIPYFIMTGLILGLMIPAGLFVPSILAGAVYGRIWGHALNSMFPGRVADAGTYSLMGAAAINGGITRMTISMTIIMLETAGNMSYLLPLMVTFASARYTGNALNMGIYDIQLAMKNLPYLESSLHTLGIMNYNPVTEIMSAPVVTLSEIDKVSTIVSVLKETKHNGFPVVDINGKLRGLILRKTVTSLLQFKGFSAPDTHREGLTRRGSINPDLPPDAVPLAVPAATVFYETIEKQYPHYPSIENIELSDDDMNLWLDLRPYMDTSCYVINSTASIFRTHREFRTMGMRHLVVLDGEHCVVGMITRKDILDKTLRSHWQQEGKELEQNINVEAIPPGIVYDFTKPAVSSVAAIPIKKYSDYGDDEDHFDELGSSDNGRFKRRNLENLHDEHEIAAYDKLDVTGKGTSDDGSEGSEHLIDQSPEFWHSLGISRERKISVSQATRDDFCDEDDRLETAEDAPDLEFQDRLQRRNSSAGMNVDNKPVPTTYQNIRSGAAWSGLRLPKR